MSFAEIVGAIRERFADEVATPADLVVVYDNAPAPTHSGTWARFSVLIDGSEQIHAGTADSRRYRATGRAIANLLAPVLRGDGALLELADDVAEAFRGHVMTDPIIYFGTPSLVGSADRDEAWFLRTISIPFEADTFG